MMYEYRRRVGCSATAISGRHSGARPLAHPVSEVGGRETDRGPKSRHYPPRARSSIARLSAIPRLRETGDAASGVYGSRSE